MPERPRSPSRGALDLNLLVFLDALLELRSVTATARRLGVTQSAVSHALGRLRRELGDPLLVRTAAGMTPTRRAEELRDPLRRGLESLRLAARPADAFDPPTSARTFTLAASDQIGVLLLPELAARLAARAPRVDLRVKPIVRDVERALETGSADLVVTGAFQPADAPGLYRQRLFDERLVCLVRADHPTVKERMTLEAYCALSHALIAPRGGAGIVDERLAARGLSRRVAVVLPHFLAAPFVIARSDLVLTVAESVGSLFRSLLPLRVVPPPLELPRATYYQVWHAGSQDDPGHKWLRVLVAEVAADRA